jgi:hypothetical protein
MLKHLLPAWLPLLLLITFLGCQSLEIKPDPVIKPIEVARSCTEQRKVIHFDAITKIQICGKAILKTQDKLLFSDLQILKKISTKQYEVVFTAENFRQFQWSHKEHKNLDEILLINLNDRYKILNIQNYQINCQVQGCIDKVDNCSANMSANLFPNVAFRTKLLQIEMRQQETLQKNILQQLVWQSLNGDVRARGILLHFKDWFYVKPDTAKRYDYYKKVVEKKSQNMCIKKIYLFAKY